MIGDVRVVTHGRAATEALAAVVADAKGDRPLAPVTVVVPSNLVGLTARRLLGGGLPGTAGVANVGFVTPFRLAELLAADLLADRRPVTNPVLGAAVRQTLASTPGPFARVADHHATETSLAALYAELSRVSEATLEALAGAGGRGAEAVAIFRAIAERLADFDGEDEVAIAAAGRPDLARALAPFGHLVWHLPAPTTPALGRLLTAAFQAAPSAVVLGLTGAAGADAAVRATAVSCGAALPADAPADAPATASHLVSVADADEEVRAVIRRIAALAEDGVPLDRIGVFYPVPDPYVTVLAQQLADASLPANGPSRERLADSVVGRSLLAAVALPAQRWRRDRVMALVAGAPIRHDGTLASPAAWEDLSRRAGVVADLSDWHRKLGSLATLLAERAIEDDTAGEEPRAARRRRDQAQVERLDAFVTSLADAVARVDRADGWAATSEAAKSLVELLVGPESSRSMWPEHERQAAERVEDALSRLATLDPIDPDPSPETFRRALTNELDVARGRVGRFGEGVLYGPLVSAVGLDLDAVFVVGLAEGICPASRRDDALLPDGYRELAIDGELALRGARLDDQHRALLAALSAAPEDRRWLVHPRGDLRSSRHLLPSRWMLDSATALTGATVFSTDFGSLGAPHVDVVASFTAGVRSAGARASVLDRDLTAVDAFVTGGGDAAAHPDLAPVVRSLHCLAERSSDRFTTWDGNLSGLPVPSPAGGELLSATRLQNWAACGFRYLLGSVFGLDDRDDPARIVSVSPLDRGTAVHLVLERFIEEVIVRGAPDPDEPWSDQDRRRLQEIATEVFGELEARGRTGRPLLWRLEAQRLGSMLDTFLDHDDEFRREQQCRPERVELPFGLEDSSPVAVELRDHRPVLFRGKADRVDRSTDGSVVVTDYKTGKGDGYKRIDEGDPTQGGTTLQLGLYSEAARQLLGATEVAAHYWMVDDRGGYARHGYAWTEDRQERFTDVITAIVTGIEDGVFAAQPGEYDSWRGSHKNCQFCPFDSVCPRERAEQAEAKSTAPELTVREALLEDGDDEEVAS